MLHQTQVVVNQAAPGLLMLAAAVPGYCYQVHGFLLGLAAAGTWKFTDGSGDLMGPVSVIKDAPPLYATPADRCILETRPNSPLNLETTGGGAKGIVLLSTERG